MFEIRITDMWVATQIGPYWADATITLLNHLDMMEFPDWDNQLKVIIEDVHFSDYPDAPKKKHIKRILDFTAGLENQECKLLIHCAAGISRSTAAAIAVLAQQGLDPDKAVRHVSGIRNISYPNELITQHADEFLNLGGMLNKAVKLRHKERMNALTGRAM